MTPEQFEYTQVREYAQQSLWYVWKTFNKKTNEICNDIKSTVFLNMDLEDHNKNKIDLEEIVNNIDIVKGEILKLIKDITEIEFENNEDEKYTPDNGRDVKELLSECKVIDLHWFQAFITDTHLDKRALESIHFLTKNFYQQNLWIRSIQNDPNMLAAKQKSWSDLMNWMTSNKNSLLISYDQMILNVVELRNVQQHWKSEYYTTKANALINEILKDPLTDLEQLPINNYTLFISISNQITGLIRSLQIFYATLKLSSVGGVKLSMKSKQRSENITCCNCHQKKIIPFIPKNASEILCNECLWEEELKLVR